ncbi:hypothetical protein [Solibacillus sp. FSL H8-0538]|uniref:hypothetical protein n=1 Tax=Solibacillus sp. FSL H8-0538 TaxID=2921400 RepID=UPI0030FBF713
MNAVHFYENKTVVLTQSLNSVPAVDQDIKIKGRKGKVVSVVQIDENKYHVQVIFEKVVVKKPLLTAKELAKSKKR